MILAGDISAQQTRLTLYEHDKDAKGRIHLGKPKTERFFTHSSCSSLNEIFADFFAQEEVKQAKTEIYVICLSIAGPIEGKCFTLTNALWEKNEKEFCKEKLTEFLFCPVPILFLNDMEAIGYSIFPLPPEERRTLDIISLNETKPTESTEEEKYPYALMLVVDGLGQALWSWNEKRQEYKPSPSEGGHTDFAARNDEEMNLLKYFRSQSPDPKHSPISYEQVLSVDGLLKILAFVEENNKQSQLTFNKQDLEKRPVDVEEKIAMLAEAAINNDLICKKAWNIFLSILGAQAGNIALIYRAKGGIYLTGFVLVKLVERLRQKQVAIETFFKPFIEAFSHKEGPFAEINKKTPVYIVCKPDLAMIGAAQQALPWITKGFFEVHKKLAK